MFDPVTICIRCKHHQNTHDGRSSGPPAKSWFYQICKHPEFERPKCIEPIFGDIGYMMQNDLGRTVIVQEPHPYCRDINDGNCRFFELRKGE